MDSSSQGGQSGPTSAGLRDGFLARPCSVRPAPGGVPVSDQCHQYSLLLCSGAQPPVSGRARLDVWQASAGKSNRPVTSLFYKTVWRCYNQQDFH